MNKFWNERGAESIEWLLVGGIIVLLVTSVYVGPIKGALSDAAANIAKNIATATK